MSVSETNMIDFVSVDLKKKIVRLEITDYLRWEIPEDENEHLRLLQAKLNTYLRFIESGELYENHPEARGATCEIELVSRYPLSISGVRFFEYARSIVRKAGIELSYRVFTPR
jgi:hypothetical protein